MTTYLREGERGDKIRVHGTHIILFKAAPNEIIAEEEPCILDLCEVVFSQINETLHSKVHILVHWQEL